MEPRKIGGVQYVDETCWKIACKNDGVDAGLIETILKL